MLALTCKEGLTVDASDRELQQYLFDLQGYLVIHNVLGASELAELNRLIDGQRLPSPRESIRFGSAAGVHGPDHGFLNWGEPFCRLLDHQAIMPVLRFRLGDCFPAGPSYGIRMHKGQTMGAMHRGLRRLGPQLLHQAGGALSFCQQRHLRGVHGSGLESCRCRSETIRGILVHSRESQESLQAAAPDPRGPRKKPPAWSFRTYRRGRWSCSPRPSCTEQPRGRADHERPDSALQVLRLPDGLVPGAGASATRCPAHPSAASAPHRAGGSPHVRSFTLQRRAPRGAVAGPARSGRTPIRRPLRWPSLLWKLGSV